MSRIGRAPVLLPEGVNVQVDGFVVSVTGPNGSLSKIFSGDLKIHVDNQKVTVDPIKTTKSVIMLWGTTRSIINNMVIGVSEYFKEELEINGVGYRASMGGGYLNLSVGKSHNIKVQIPEIISINVPKANSIALRSIDKEKLGHFSSLLIRQCPPEPYKGKGIRRVGQYIQRKEGKKAK